MFEQSQTRSTTIFIQPMEYRAIVAADLAAPDIGPDATPDVGALQARIRELDLELEQQSRVFESSLQTARNEAREAGRASERSENAYHLSAATKALTEALSGFAASRDEYLAQVEREVVKLALAIAARVLRRETLMDPLLLAGAVRVAFGQLADTTEVRLKVPVAEHELWREMLRLMPNLPLHPEVIADEILSTGDCLLETRLGTVDLGVRSQLAEIERGFFDLLEQRDQQRNPRDYREPSGASTELHRP